jgi:site-specific DNA-methyltransferase (adenine-specific)
MIEKYRKGIAHTGAVPFFMQRMRCLCPVKLLHGDCLELMKEIPDKSIDMILCDLPYGTTACKWDSVIPFEPLWEQYSRIIKDNGAIVLFSAQPFTTALISSNLKQYRYNWYWKKNNKTGFTFAKYQPMRCIEDICVFYKKAPLYNPQGLIALENPKVRQKNPTLKDTTHRLNKKQKPFVSRFTNYPAHLLEFANEAASNRNRFHPTQKPVDLLEYLIKTYTNEGETVLDNCMGSGSTGVACVNTGRQFIGIEKDKNYFNIAEGRIKEASGNTGASFV